MALPAWMPRVALAQSDNSRRDVILSIFLPVMLIIGFFVWMQRRAQGQMGGVMSIGKSKAKSYDADRPSTTFDDIAGYEGVKQARGQPTLDHQPAELRLAGEVLVKMQGISVPADLGESLYVPVGKRDIARSRVADCCFHGVMKNPYCYWEI